MRKSIVAGAMTLLLLIGLGACSGTPQGTPSDPQNSGESEKMTSNTEAGTTASSGNERDMWERAATEWTPWKLSELTLPDTIVYYDYGKKTEWTAETAVREEIFALNQSRFSTLSDGTLGNLLLFVGDTYKDDGRCLIYEYADGRKLTFCLSGSSDYQHNWVMLDSLGEPYENKFGGVYGFLDSDEALLARLTELTA